MGDETFDQFIRKATPEQIRKLYETMKEVDDQEIKSIADHLLCLIFI